MTRSRERQAVRWCSRCHSLQGPAEACIHCGPGDQPLVPLVRGLASLERAGEHGLVRYRGERLTAVAGALLLLLLPVAGVLAFVAHLPSVVPALLGLCFIGLPVLAFVDARRAGALAAADRTELPDVVPAPAGEPVGPRLRGRATRIHAAETAPVSQATALAYRVDIRAGRGAELLARVLRSVDFLVTAGDGSQLLVTGVVELEAAGYRAVERTSDVTFTMNGLALLPAVFVQGGLACELSICAGDTVEVCGPPSDETCVHPLGAGYRTAAVIPVLRGTPGRPVVLRWVPQ